MLSFGALLLVANAPQFEDERPTHAISPGTAHISTSESKSEKLAVYSPTNSAPPVSDLSDYSIDSFNKSIGLTRRTLSCLQKGNANSQRGAYLEAVMCFDQAISQNPRYASAFNNRGLAREWLGDKDGAKRDYLTAINLNPKFSIPHNNLGSLFFIENDVGSALAEYQKAVNIAPNCIYLDNLGCAKERLGDREGALREYTRSVQLNPAYALGYKDRAGLLNSWGKVREALRDFDRAILLNPTDSDAYFKRGYAREMASYRLSASERKSESKLAIEDYSEAIKIRPTFAYAYISRAFVESFAGNDIAAVQDFDQAIRLHPSGTYYQGRAHMRKRCGDLIGAMSDLDQAISRNTLDLLNAYIERARLRAVTGDYRGAIQSCIDAYKIDAKRTVDTIFVQSSWELQSSIRAAYIKANKILKSSFNLKPEQIL